MIDKKVQILSKVVSSKQQGGVSSSVSGGSSSVVYNNIDLLSLDAIAEPSEHNAFSALRALYEQKKEIENRLIKSEDEKEADDSTFYTSLRTLKEINNSIKNLYDIFLRKDQSDSTEHLITFLAGLKIGAKYSINEVGNAVLNNIESSVIDSIQAKFHELESTKLNSTEGTIDTLTALTLFVKTLADVEELNVKETATILNAVVKASLSSPKFVSGFLGEGFRINQKSNGDWNLEIDTLTVRKVFQVFELLIQEVKHQGGVVIHSPAGGKITKVTDGGTYWRCEHDGIDDFVVNDQVLCQVFKGGKIKRYWRLATSAGEGFVNLSKTKAESNSDVPEVGDEIIQLGNQTNTARQSAHIVNVIGENAPHTAYLSGINSFTLVDKEVLRLGNLEGIVDETFGALKGYGLYGQNAYLKGVFQLTSGKTIEQALQESTDFLGGNITNVKNELLGNIRESEGRFNTGLANTKNELTGQIDSTKSELGGLINQAQSTAENALNEINSLEFVVKNLLRWSAANTANYFLYNIPIGKIEDTNDGVKLTRAEGLGNFGVQTVLKNKIGQFDAGETYTVSAYIRGSIKNLNYSYIMFESSPNFYLGNIEGIDKINEETFVLVKKTFKLNRSGKAGVMLANSGGDAGEWFEIKDGISIVKGSKPAIDWTAAPEDYTEELKKEITSVRTDFQVIEGQINANITKTTNLVNESQGLLESTTAQIANLDLTADKFNVTLGEINKKQDEIEGSISEVNQTAKGLSLTVEGFKETEREIKNTASRIESTHEGIVLEASEKSAQKAIDGLEIGTINLLWKSEANTSNYYKWSPTLGVIENTDYGLKITRTSSGDNFGIQSNQANRKTRVNKGEVYTVSFRARGTMTNLRYSFLMYTEGGNYNFYGFHNESKLQEDKFITLYATVTAPRDGEVGVLIGNSDGETVSGKAGEWIEIEKGIKLEKGNKPTDWSPAPEDIENQIETTRTEFDSKLEITKEAITATSAKVDGLTGRVQETEAKLEPDRLWVAVKDNSQKLIDDLDTVNRNYAYIDEYNYICLSNDFPRNKKQYLSLSLWGNFEEFANVDPFGEIYFGGNLDSYVFGYKYIKKSDNHIVFEGGYVDLSLENGEDLILSLGQGAPEELITKVKIDVGTKATDWTPAPEELLTPEDIKASIELTTNGLNVFGKHHSLEGKVTFASLASDAQGKINSAQSTADSANRDLGALKGSLKSLAYQDKVEEAMLGETIIDGGYLRTELIQAKSITAEKIDVDNLIGKKLQTEVNGPRIEAIGSELKVYGYSQHPNIIFGIDKDGYSVLKYLNNDGEEMYNLGPNGIVWGLIKPSSFTKVRFYKLSAYKEKKDLTYFDVSAIKEAIDDWATDFYRYFAGSNPTIKPEDREPEKYIYKVPTLTSLWIDDGVYCTPPISTDKNSQYDSDNTGELIQPGGSSSLYQFTTGVYNKPPIYVAVIYAYKGGMLAYSQKVYWNGGMPDPSQP